MNNMSNEEILEPIQNALYATNRFTTDECNTLADGILMYLKDAGYSISADQEKEKVAVAFAEWKDNNVFGFGYYSISNSREYMFFQSMPDLYQYFITNVYNK